MIYLCFVHAWAEEKEGVVDPRGLNFDGSNKQSERIPEIINTAQRLSFCPNLEMPTFSFEEGAITCKVWTGILTDERSTLLLLKMGSLDQHSQQQHLELVRQVEFQATAQAYETRICIFNKMPR